MGEKALTYHKICLIIDSCESFDQLRDPITKLIVLFINKYKDYDMADELDYLRNQKRLEL